RALREFFLVLVQGYERAPRVSQLPIFIYFTLSRYHVTVHTPLSREVFWHEHAKIPRHTSQNSIAAGNLEFWLRY
ncbi:hypothetical protein, partial [Blautia wexlerae]|uniref:hypothetical protein n=1 Tax=Blautia wexlerae TaxID=418240 RepID=UPI0034A54127